MRDVIWCGICGEENSTDDRFCTSCGAALDAVPQPRQVVFHGSARRGGGASISVGIALVLAGILLYASRDQVLVAVLGRDQIIVDLFSGQHKVRGALLALNVACVLAVIVGIIRIAAGVRRASAGAGRSTGGG